MAQIFTNEGLQTVLNQVITSSPTTFSALYVGLFTGLTGSTVPAASATLASGITEQNGSGYSRQSCAFTLGSATAYTVPLAQTTLNGSVTSSYVLTVGSFTTGSYAGLAVGMTLYINSTAYTITGLPGSSQIVISSAITASNNATITIGDAVTGQKATGAQVTFSATGSWSSANCGFFITTVASGTSGKLLYAANFADASTPTLSANDTLKVTPVWLMSN